MRPRLLWMATADARGHLMRAQLLWHELRHAGFAVEVLTTSRPGVEFLAACGVPSDLLSPHYRVEFDDAHNMSAWRTDLMAARYLADPGRMRRDLEVLAARARGCDLVVNDSFHPALLAAPVLRPDLRVVHVYAQHLRPALEQHYGGRLPGLVSGAFRRGMGWLIDRAAGRLCHGLGWESGAARVGERLVPPVMQRLRETPEAVRRRLGIGRGQRLAVVYLNPHFRAPRIASAVEAALRAHNVVLYGVGEGYGGRAGWRPYDPQLADVLAAADLYVSSPGMGALNQTSLLGVPFLALVTRQPEQRRNLDLLPECGVPWRAVTLTPGNDPTVRLTESVAALLPRGSTANRATRGVPSATAQRIDHAYRAWIDALSDLAGLEARTPQRAVS